MTDNDFNPVVEIQAEVQVTPTLELQAEVDMGSLASERNAEAWAVGQRGGVDVSSTDQTYHNNAKYWAEQAEQTVVGSIIDDTSTALNKTWSAHKVSEEFAETNGEVADLKSAKAPIIMESISTHAAVQSFTDGADGMPMALEVAVEPVQDLHGQDNPYPGGGGKNLLPMTLQNLKAMNTEDTWNGNVYTRRGVTYTVNTDDGGNVVSITVNGTATYDSSLVIADSMNAILTVDSEYTLTGCPASGSGSTYAIVVGTSPSNGRIYVDAGSGETATYTSAYAQTDRKCFIVVYAGKTASNLSFAPMMRLSSESSAYAPYSNICPITGHTQAVVTRTGRNLYNKDTAVLGKYINGSGVEANNAYCAHSDYIKVVPNENYYCNSTCQGTTHIIRYFDRNKNLLGDNGNAGAGVYNVGNAEYVIVNTRTDQISVDDVVFYVSDTNINGTYFPYQGVSVTIPFGQTVYGGTLTVERDGTGTLVVDRGIANLDELEFVYNSANHVFISYDIPAHKTTTPNCSCYKGTDPASGNGGAYSKGNCTCCFLSSGDMRLYIRDDKYTDPTVLSSALSGQKLVYELAESVVYTLTAPQVLSLLGTNNLWADVGNINAVDYPADTKLYIDKKLTELQALVLEN